MQILTSQLPRQLTLLNTFLKCAMKAFWHRRHRGPRYANWSWLMESVADVTIDAVPKREQMTADEIRELFRRTAVLPVPTLATIAPVTLGGVTGERQTPHHTVDGRVVLFFHGGGYIAGSPQSHRLLTTRIAKEAKAVLYSMAYRLAPEHPYPAALEDAWRAYWGLLEQGVAPQNIVLGGDSAGGGLSLALLLAAREAHLPLPAAAFCLSPFLDLSCETAAIQVGDLAARLHANVHGNEAASEQALADYLNLHVLRYSAHAYLAGADARDPFVSPLFADLRGLPPLLIQAGSTEVLAGDALQIAERARGAGVDVQLSLAPHMIHVYQFLYHIAPEAEEAVREIGRFVQNQVRL
ncbi:MAG: alpha/beta hydrolase [Caldilineaceae bacterium]|nr:alpha/beta hydrolase [Caldilineaceae bacterium]